MKFNSGFLNGTKGIFKDKKNNDNQKKTRKMRKSNSNQIGGTAKSDKLGVESTQDQRVTKNKPSYKNKDIKYKNNKKKRKKKGKPRVKIIRESSDEYSSEDEEESVSDLPGLQVRDRHDSESENDENNNNSDRIEDRADVVDDVENKNESSRNRNKD